MIRQAEPEGTDYVFNGMGEETFERGLAVLRQGGILVHYGAPQSLGYLLLLDAKLPLLEAAKGYELLESGQVTGNIVLIAPELL